MMYKIDNHENFVLIEFESTNHDKIALQYLYEKIQILYDAKNNLIIHFNQNWIQDDVLFEKLQKWHRKFYHQSTSFVLCDLPKDAKINLNEVYFDNIHYAPTLAEAIDIVSMEVLERELFDGDDFK
jgi:hypothetical protein